MPYLSFPCVIILYQNMAMILFRGQKWMSRTWKYWMGCNSHLVRSKSGYNIFLSDVNSVKTGSTQELSDWRVRCRWILVSCPTILLVRLSHLSDYRIELSVRTRPFWSWPSRSGEINAGTIDRCGSGAAKFGRTIKLDVRKRRVSTMHPCPPIRI